jgi:hypothetical protein
MSVPVPHGRDPGRRVGRLTIPRRRDIRDPIRFGSGVDFGSDGISLAEVRDGGGHPLRILAWFKGHKAPNAGVPGFGHHYVPARLKIVWRQGFESCELQRGGRLSVDAIRRHAAEIDRHFGPGTAARIDPRCTLVIADG